MAWCHGESLGENGIYLHGLSKPIAPEAQRHVPMPARFSGAFARDFSAGAVPRGVREDARELSHDVLNATLLGLHGVRTRLYRSALDVFADAPDLAAASARPCARRASSRRVHYRVTRIRARLRADPPCHPA